MKVLHIEDSKDYAQYVKEEMRSSDHDSELDIISVPRVADAKALLGQDDCDIDLILLDLSLPDANGMSGIKKVRKSNSAIPIIVLSGTGERELGLEAIRNGAQDYIMKDTFTGELLYKSIDYAMERKRLQDEMIASALTDLVTGLPNRSYFIDHLKVSIERVKRSGKTLFLLYLDFDGFKQINDTCGHTEGDHFLGEVGARLKNAVRQSDFCGRLGGDEFAVLIESDHKETEKIEPMIEALLQNLRLPYKARNGDHIVCYCSVGVTMFDPSTQKNVSVTQLLQEADDSMYAAKRQGGDCYQAHDSAAHLATKQSASISLQLRTALQKHEFFLLYQPIVDSNTRAVRSLECLLRWRKEDGSVIPPDNFITSLEKCKMINEVGNWIIDTAVTEYITNVNKGIIPEGTSLSLNISPDQLTENGFIDFVTSQVERCSFNYPWLTLEITERMFRSNFTDLVPIVDELRNIGVKIAIDDFGTGHSNLASLLVIPFDIIKIDKSFISGIFDDDVSSTLIQALIYIVRSLGKDIVIEGVETDGVSCALAKMGAHFQQGYLFSQPLPMHKITYQFSEV